MLLRTELSAAAWPAAVSSLANCQAISRIACRASRSGPRRIERHVLEQIRVKRRQQPLDCLRD